MLLAAAPPPGIRWIAHRGGIVDARFSENSPASLEAAVEHGYWMIECDIRETKDHRIITHHDPDLRRFYNDPRKVQDVTFEEIRRLRAQPGGTPPMSFTELMQKARGRLRLMLDIKEPEHGPAFYAQMEKELRAAALLESAYVIGLPAALHYFRGKAKVAATFEELEKAVMNGEPVARLYFLFEWGRTLTADQVKFAQSHRVPVVPSVNTFHYVQGGHGTPGGVDPIAGGTADLQRLRKMGVTEFQIDSVYEPAFR
jgi:glycerophosphoryl diester phosphodiesterase